MKGEEIGFGTSCKNLIFQCLFNVLDILPPRSILAHSNIFTTSMHSSRMRIARLLPVSPSMHCTGGVCSGGVSWGGVCSRVVCSGGVCSRGVSALAGDLLRGVVSAAPGGVCSMGGLLLGWGWGGYLSQHALRQTPPVNSMIDSCKNITFANFFCWR